jgi:hypothetical protein
MSLLLHKGAIARAVLGELPAAEEGAVREHLRACASCRALYDVLSSTKGAIDGGVSAEARARARLLGALDGERAPVAAPPARRRFSWGAVLVLAPAAAVVLWLARPAPPPADDGRTERGAAGESRPAPATLVVYASRKTGPTTHGPVRLVAELPGSGEARVSLADYLQLGVRGLRAPAHVRVVGVDEAGGVHDLVRDTALGAGAGASTLGASVDLARGHAAGRLRLVAVFAKDAVGDEAVRAAVARLDPRRTERGGEPGLALVTGLLVIEP